MRRWQLIALLVLPILGFALRTAPVTHATEKPMPVISTPETPGGSLRIIPDRPDAPIQELPLRHTTVTADVAGNLSAVTVRQEFVNPATEPIEAVYVFPLPEDAAVHAMELHIGDRVVKGVVRTRAEARRTYEEAKANGRRTGLLEQERPNIFTQSVANIQPGESIVVEIRYVHALVPDAGEFTFAYPMVVGPRYIPGEALGHDGTGWAPDTNRVPDASRVTPPVLPPDARSGHDLDLTVRLNAGLPIDQLRSLAHRVDTETPDAAHAVIRIHASDRVPNKDFVLRWRTPTRAITPTLLAHRTEGDGHFLLLVQPPEAPTEAMVTAKELIFIVDTSGSMSGQPLANVQAAMRYALEHLNPQDTFTILSFQHTTDWFSEQPVPATRAHIARAQRYIDALRASGGTEMLRATQAALRLPASDDHRVRIVSLMSDGYVGNEREILAQVAADLGDARLFPFGVGSSVNRFLITGLAQVGRGYPTIITRAESEEVAVQKFYDRIAQPLLTNVRIDWGNLAVTEITPNAIPDLFAGQLIAVTGTYTHDGSGTIRVRGTFRGTPTTFDLPVTLPESESAHAAIPTIWARMQVHALTHDFRADAAEQTRRITDLGLRYGIATAHTSFVAVEETPPGVPGKPPRTIPVPILIPDGVSYEGVFGDPTATFGVAMSGLGGATDRKSLGVASERKARQPVPVSSRDGKESGVAGAPPTPVPRSVLLTTGLLILIALIFLLRARLHRT